MGANSTEKTCVALLRLWTYHVLEMRKVLLSGLPIQSGCACDSLEFWRSFAFPRAHALFRSPLFLFPAVRRLLPIMSWMTVH